MPIPDRSRRDALLAPTSGDAPENRDPREPRTVRDRVAGEVIIAVAVAVAFAGLLNGQELLATAERQELGTTRDVTVALARPLASVSATLGFDRPRAAIDQALGRGEPEPADPSPVIASEPPTDVEEPDGADADADADGDPDANDDGPDQEPSPQESPPEDPPPPEPVPEADPITPDDPLTMYVGGDSMVGQFGVAMDDLANDTGLITTTEVRYEFGSGISRPDFIDWPAVLEEVSTTQDPDVMVLYFGGNDAQALEIDDTVRQPEDPEWQEEYRSRVSDLMDQLVDAGHTIYWMGMPIARDQPVRDRLEMLNGIYADEADARDEVTFIPTWELFSGPDGEFSEYLPNDDGDEVDMRLDDGIHLTTAGAYRAARPTIERIVEDFDIEPAD